MIWGSHPPAAAGSRSRSPGSSISPASRIPAFRLAIIVLGLVVALVMYFVIARNAIGMWIRLVRATVRRLLHWA